MLMQEIILKKRNGDRLSSEEIDFFVKGYAAGDIPDYQAAALLMAVWFNGMDDRETVDLTLAIRDSGDIVDLSTIDGVKIDKHSTGGVADTTSLICGPLVAACGGRIAKISGRGLGHTGGTVDKLESIPGVNMVRTTDELRQIVSACGLAIVGQSPNLVPADRKLYGLRDVTGTVDNVSLISSSIMSKKLAAGADVIVLDVKAGNGSFMKKVEEGRELARSMVTIGSQGGKPTSALITDMNQPLGAAVGNAGEVEEAIEVLCGERDGDLQRVSLALAGEMLISAKLAEHEQEAEGMLQQALRSGQGLQRLQRMIELLGGDPRVCSDTSLLPQAAESVSVRSAASGFVTRIETAGIGSAAQLLGAGRAFKEDKIDPAVGLKMMVRLGDKVEKGEELVRLFVNHRRNLERATEKVRRSIVLDEERLEPPPLLHDLIRSGGR